jgi:MarR family transcriptional regulator, transcriptional regulator for hemolysin
MDRTSPTLGFLLHDVARLLRKRFEQTARRDGLGLTRSQWQVMAVLAKNEGIQQGALAELLEIEPITLVRILDRLQTLELIERRPHATDRRIWLLFLKPAAGPVLERMRELGDRTRTEALAQVSHEDQQRLMKMLSLMRENLLDACDKPVDAREAHHG